MAASAVRRQKEAYPHIESVLVPAYLHTDRGSNGYDTTVYPPLEKVPRRYAIVKRNEWMVSASDVIISGVKHNWGGAAKTLEYAKKHRKVVFQFPYRKSDRPGIKGNS